MLLGAGGYAALPTLGAAAAPPVHLDVNDPAAVALGYVEDARKVDAKKYPDFVAGNDCDSCSQLLGNAGDTYRPCALLPGKLVDIHGWCKAWAPQI